MIARITIAVLFLLLKTSTANADVSSCTDSSKSDFTKDLESITASLACDSDVLMLDAAKKEYNKNFKDLSKVTKTIDGLNLSGSQEEIATLEEVLRPKQNHNDDIPHSSWPKIASSCTTVICAIGKLYGSDEAGYRVLNIAKKSGYVLTASQKWNRYMKPDGTIQMEETLWSPTQIRKIDQTLNKLPPTLSQNSKLKYLYNSKYDYSDDNYHTLQGKAKSAASNKSGELIIFKPGMKNNEQFEHTLIHELAHHYEYSKGDDYLKSSGFLGISRWKPPQSKVITNTDGSTSIEIVHDSERDDNMVTNYAKDSENEDFAESVDTYVRYPEILEAISPEKYELIKKDVFNGKEYKSNWPKLDEVLKAELKGKSLTDHCVERAEHIKSGGDKTIYYEYDNNSTRIMTTGSSISDMYRTTVCFDELSKKLDEKLKCSPDYCDFVPDPGVEQLLKCQNSVKFNQLLRETDAGIKKSNLDANERCYSKKDFTKDCVFGSSVDEKMLPLIRDSVLYTEIEKVYPPEKMLYDCISQVEKITKNGDTVSYWETNTEKSTSMVRMFTTYTNPIGLSTCHKSINESLKTSDIKYESIKDYHDPLLQTDSNYKAVTKLNELVLTFAEKFGKCLDDKTNHEPCSIKITRKWAEKNEIVLTTSLTDIASKLEHLLIDTEVKNGSIDKAKE